MCQHVTPYWSCMCEIRQAKGQARSPAQHNPAAPDGGYCCHDAALQLSRLPTPAGEGIRFGLVCSSDQPRRRNVMGSSRRAGGPGGLAGREGGTQKGAWGRPGPWALGPADGKSTHTACEYAVHAVRTLDGVLSPYRPGQLSHWDRRRPACRKGEARLRWTSGRLLAERGWVSKLGISCVDRCEKKQVSI